jgi:uncharacterized protein (DUF2252 family)
MPYALDSLKTDSETRQQHIVETLHNAFQDLIEADPRAFVKKFRKMAGDPFAFYRGSACLFYSDVSRIDDPWSDERTDRVWIQADLHAENYGTYMDAEGILVFDVNDFDEAYLGHYTWDLQRMAASLALLGFKKAFSDRTIRQMIETYAGSYVAQVESFHQGGRDDEFRLTLDNTDGIALEVLYAARMETRFALLDGMTNIEDGERVFAEGPGVRRLEKDEYDEVCAAYQRYLDTIPEGKRQESISYAVKDIVGRSGFGIGSAGLPAFNVLVEGKSQALENDVVVSMKQANIAAPSRVIDDERIHTLFKHHGHRTALSQHALQSHADPWVGWTDFRGKGFTVKELSPYEADLDWDGVSEPDEIMPLLRYLGQATAKVHCVSDAESEHSIVEYEVEEAITNVIGGRETDFVRDLADFGMAYGDLTRDDYRLFVDAFRNGRIRGVPET